ncbi:uncharacterized protein KY384_008109 [Bacidia gigantensis]|uniref:uncharacterized protein n=1 Tax=Bacidia gigantensis TaxID=2732470 RepID=UPI001D055529|nr:uncharacterized protein KY384_008109 [Bacidia gigantensis]KAG8526680.1 hypothetical protein KY384_008109 [Bacidia gigantensis]
MADPLSVTASAVSITSFGISLCKTVLDFYQSVKGSRRDVRELCEMIERLQRTLTEVEKVIQGSSHRDIAATAFENLEACKAGLDRLAHKMEKSRKVMTNSVARFPAALQYPFRESTIIRLREIVSHELLSHLNLSINILKLDVSEANHQSTQMGLSSINANIDSVRDETSLALSELKDGVSNAAIFAKSHDMGEIRRILT